MSFHRMTSNNCSLTCCLLFLFMQCNTNAGRDNRWSSDTDEALTRTLIYFKGESGSFFIAR